MAGRAFEAIEQRTGRLQSGAWPRPKNLLFAFIGLMFAYVLWTDESFLFNMKDPAWAHIERFKWWLLPHGLTAACALFLGPLQFSDRLRQRFTKMHRVIGRIYVAGVFIGARSDSISNILKNVWGNHAHSQLPRYSIGRVDAGYGRGHGVHFPGEGATAPAMDDA